MLTDHTPDGWVPLAYATQALGVSRQTALHKVKRGELLSRGTPGEDVGAAGRRWR
jgi:hypothetical protein